MLFRALTFSAVVSGAASADAALRSGSAVTLQALPAVESVLSRATDKAEEFAQQAAVMQKRVAARQQESESRLAAQRDSYNSVLNGKTLLNRMLSANNRRFRAEIKEHQAKVEAEKKLAQAAHKGTLEMRGTLISLQKKLGLAKDFLLSSLNVTDDHQQEVLKILEPPKPKPTLRHFLQVAARKLAPPTSLLQESVIKPNDEINTPQELLPMLTESIKSIEEAEREGEAALKNQFMEALEKCNGTRVKLLQDQLELNSTSRDLERMHANVTRARGVLANSSTFLFERLAGIKFLANRLTDDVDDALMQADAVLNGSVPEAKAGANSTEVRQDMSAKSNATGPAPANQSTELRAVPQAAVNASTKVATPSPGASPLLSQAVEQQHVSATPKEDSSKSFWSLSHFMR